VTVYASDKIEREIRNTWLKTAVVENSSGETVAGPFGTELPLQGAAVTGVPLLFPISLKAAKLKDGDYQIKIKLTPRTNARRSVTLTAPINVRQTPP
jgi:predicted peptidase